MTQEVLKLALEALETELSIDWTNNDEFNASAEKMYEAIAAIKEALAQEKALQALHSENERLGLYKDAYAEQEPVVVVCCQQYDTCLKPCTPRGRHLAQRTWVGLAAEDRLTAKYMQDAPDGIESVIDYIEAKLKDKNCAG
jgi:hypothetical protein